MVSGFFTSPCDHRRIWSAVASPILSWSNMLTSSIVPVLVPFARRVSVDALAPRAVALAIVFVGAALGAADVDAELLGRAEHVLVELTHLDLRAIGGEHLDVEAQRLHLLHEHLEA